MGYDNKTIGQSDYATTMFPRCSTALVRFLFALVYKLELLKNLYQRTKIAKSQK